MSALDNKAYQWIEAITAVAASYDLNVSKADLTATAQWEQATTAAIILPSLARKAGLSCSQPQTKNWSISALSLPLVIELHDGTVAVVTSIGSNQELTLMLAGEQQAQTHLFFKELKPKIKQVFILRPLRAKPDVRVDSYLKPYQPHWLLSILFNDSKPYWHILLASLFANLLALAGIIFTRQVYDRVIPSESYVTLYVLFGGVLIAVIFEYILRISRIRISDLIGKRADLRISDLIFGRALHVKNTQRPKSSGAFVAQIRDLESVREMLTSSTVMLAADLPFFFLFLFVFWQMAGVLTFVPLVALVLMVLPSLLAQPMLARLAKESMREATLRNAMLVESIQGLEDIKVLQAESRFQNQWNHYNQVSADMSLRLRFLSNSLQVWSSTVQSLVFACIVLFGAPLVIEGTLSVGTLVASSILSSRMIAPMGQLTQLLNRWQQAKTGYKNLDNIMSLPVDNPADEHLVHNPNLTGNYTFNQAHFSYDDLPEPALLIGGLSIKAGEKIAVLGRNGAGKSTFLQALAGLIEPEKGEVLLDGVNLKHLDSQDLRRDVGFLGQNARLFYGTLRENICLGYPQATEDEIRQVLQMSGADAFIQRLPKGLEHVVFEGGGGLSGGQRQSILLARLFLCQPQIVLLDEPTSALDDVTETVVLNSLKKWLKDRTLIVVTHKQQVLHLVDRVIMVDEARIKLDDTKQMVLNKLAKRA